MQCYMYWLLVISEWLEWAKSKMLGHTNATENIKVQWNCALPLQTEGKGFLSWNFSRPGKEKGKGWAFLWVSASQSPVTEVALGNSSSWLSRHSSRHIDNQIVWTVTFFRWDKISSRVEVLKRRVEQMVGPMQEGAASQNRATRSGGAPGENLS